MDAYTRYLTPPHPLKKALIISPTMYSLTGRPILPPMFALAYHQCRWNYRDQKDVEEVYSKFEELDFPLDVLWLDIEHTDGKRYAFLSFFLTEKKFFSSNTNSLSLSLSLGCSYFTWDKHKFPNPAKMQMDLARTGRRLVTIVDPHVKRDSGYHVHSQAEAQGRYVRENNADFEGWCWPGCVFFICLHF